MSNKERCQWVTDDLIYQKYHDEEWGIPSFDDRYLFEMLTLEGAQAGLSWLTILKRRGNYRKAFANFDIKTVSQYDEMQVQKLLNNKGIIRNELKIRSVITNAKVILNIQKEFDSFANYIWGFVDGKPIINHWQSANEVPAYTKESIELSKDMKKRGFSFVGPTICYAFMQATGMVNDHEKCCFLYQKGEE